MDSVSKIVHAGVASENVKESRLFELLQFPTIAEVIFENLPARDLSSCSKLCRSWNAIATSIKQRRADVYVISKTEPGVREFENGFSDLVSNLRSDPTVAISFFLTKPLEEADESESDRQLFRCHYSNEDEGYFPDLEQQYMVTIQNARKQKTIRRHLPRNCRLSHLMTPRWANYMPPGFPSSVLVLTPCNPEIQIRSFVVPTEDPSNFAVRRQIAPLFLSEEESSLSSKAKCFVVFAHPKDVDTTFDTKIYLNEEIEKEMSEETIVVTAWDSLFPTSMGIAFAGNGVRIECFAVGARDCCVEHCFLSLKDLGLNEATGIAFVLKRHDGFASSEFSSWSSRFPNITPLLIEVSEFRAFCATTDIYVQSCNQCEAEQDLSSFLFVFVLFKKTECKIIRN